MSQFRRKLLESYATNKLVYPGLIAAWSAKGKTNDDKDRAILKDLTGNGHDITLNNFAYSGMSGYGGYETKVNSWHSDMGVEVKKEGFKWEFSSIKNLNAALMYYDFDYNGTSKIRVQNIPQNIIVKCGDNRTNTSIKDITKDGIYEIDWSLLKSNTLPVIYTDKIFNNSNLIIEILPKYPDALVFDGVDDWGISKSLPILTDYTIIVKRVFLDNEKGYSGTIAAKGVNPENLGAFCFERNDNTYFSQNSFGGGSRIKIDKNVEISWQTTLSYLGKAIQRGRSLDEPTFTIGTSFSRYYFLKGAIYSAYLFDRSLDEQEIKAFIRKHIDPEYLLPSEIPTPDVYYDFTNGDNSKGEANNVITDLSGNGNDAVAHNFAWNEESGYAEGRLKFDGVDDYISLDTFDSVFKTMFMVCTNFEAPAGSILYDQRSKLFNKNYSVAYYPSSIAYNNDNINGTYINGTLNTKLACQELNNKKHLIHVVAKDISESRKPNIGRSLGQNQYSNMMLYKFLGFKEALTEEQIKAVINKYNLLDGVDNIDVN